MKLKKIYVDVCLLYNYVYIHVFVSLHLVYDNDYV